MNNIRINKIANSGNIQAGMIAYENSAGKIVLPSAKDELTNSVIVDTRPDTDEDTTYASGDSIPVFIRKQGRK